MAARDDPTISFATQLLELIHRAETTTSYKYALLTALFELASERHGGATDVLTTRQLAQRVVELYWPQARRYQQQALAQSSARGRSIVDYVVKFRAELGDRVHAAQLAALRDPDGYRQLVDTVEWLLIRNPIPRLQRIGRQSLDLLYNSHEWPEEPGKKDVTAYQAVLAGRRDVHEFNNRILLHEGVEARLALLAPLFLPLIRREWTRFVARRNRQNRDEVHLEEWLFSPARERLDKLRPGLLRLQSKRCFYCDGALHRNVQVDHFLAWSRCGASAIDNLVVAHEACNLDKSDLLVASRHLEHWTERLARRRDDLSEIAEQHDWYCEHARVGALVRSSYDNLGDGTPLWLDRQQWIAAAGDLRLAPTRAALGDVLHALQR